MAEVLERLLRMSSITSVGAEENISAKKTKRTSRKIEAFRNSMQNFIHEKIDERFDTFLDTDYISDIKIAARKDSGHLLMAVKKDNMDFDFYMATNYKVAEFFIQNRNSKSKNIALVQKWFRSHLGNDFPKMKMGKTSSKKRIVTLDTYKIENSEDRELALQEFQAQIIHVLEKVLPVIHQS